jgi:hypothetical protein
LALTIAEFLSRAVEVGVVAKCEDRSADAVQQPPGLARRIERRKGDVAGACE